MTCTYELDWQGRRLILKRNDIEPEVQDLFPLPPAPGAGEIRFPALFLYTNGEALHLEAEISGGKIARVYLDGYFETEEGWLAGPICRQELNAPQSKEIGGVEIPVWGENNKLSATWQPAIHLLISGDDAAWAFVQPSQANPNELTLPAVWTTGKQEHTVRMHFTAEGELIRMALLNGDSPRGSRGQIPQPGDQIIPAVHWLRQDDGAWLSPSGSTNPLTVTEQLPRLETIPAPPGRYHIGLLVYDLDGRAHRGLIPYQNGESE